VAGLPPTGGEIGAGLALVGSEIGAGLSIAGSEIGAADCSDPKKDCGDAMVAMYAGPQQGQFWQPLLQNFFLNGQCS
jgi:hypothetical protein